MAGTDPIEFTRDLANDDQQRCGNRVQLEDATGAAIAAGNPLPTTANIAGLADPLPVTLEDAAGNPAGVAANPIEVGDAGGALSVDDGGGSLTIDQATHDNLNANANLQVGDADVANGNPVPADVLTVPASAWTTLMTVVLDNDPTEYSSQPLDVSGESALWVLIGIESTGTPTNIRIQAQISHDDGTSWWDFEEGLWASLYWEDTDTATAIQKAYLLPVGGVDMIRIRAIGTGTDANNTFTVIVLARAFRGNLGVAHA